MTDIVLNLRGENTTMRLGEKTRLLGLPAILLVMLWAPCGANAQSLIVQPGTLFFRNPTGNNLTQDVTVTASNGSPGTLSTAVSYIFTGQSWMTASSTVSSSGSTVAVKIVAGNLAPGVYIGYVTVSS